LFVYLLFTLGPYSEGNLSIPLFSHMAQPLKYIVQQNNNLNYNRTWAIKNHYQITNTINIEMFKIMYASILKFTHSIFKNINCTLKFQT